MLQRNLVYLATIADSNQSIQTLDMPVSYTFLSIQSLDMPVSYTILNIQSLDMPVSYTFFINSHSVYHLSL